MQLLMLIALSVFLVKCRTVEVWDGGYPKPGKELKSEDTKKNEFNKFAIYQGVPIYGDGYIVLQKDKELPKYYDLGSFSSVITKVSPTTKEHFNSLRSARKLRMAGWLVMLGALFIGDNVRSDKITKYSLYTVGFGMVLGGTFWEPNIFKDIKDDYHRDLNQYIFGNSDKESSSNSKSRDYGLGLTFKF